MDPGRFGPRGPAGGGFGLGLSGPVPRDVWVLLGTIFVTFSLQFFPATALLPAWLRLTPAVWRIGALWQLVTYPFVGAGAPGLWFLLELLILFLFARQVLTVLGRRRFWNLLLTVAVAAALVAVAVELVGTWVTGRPPGPGAFQLLQGQHTVVAILIAAFATLYRDATIYLFFVLPIRAFWFLGLEILFAFMGFLSTRDLAGFLGLCAAVGLTYLVLVTGGGRRGLREAWLRLQALWMRWRLAYLRRRRGFTVVRGEKGDGRDPWVH
ncbi:MAG: hypothetical protein R3325_08155 [Thermoanaerobaculia bacterium]|nr:hypothetical protein [Thermoanaerobaculia bacterium]